MLQTRRSAEHYCAYGLKVASEIPLDELETLGASQHAPDVSVSFGKIEFKPESMNKDGYGFRAEENRACHQFRFAGSFLVENGTTITVEPDPDAEDRVLRLSILGPALSLAMMQQGKLVLHGSCVQIGESAAAFIGGHRWGKSTLAACLDHRNHRLITDDVLCVAPTNESVLAQPSYPQIKLWPDSASSLGKKEENLVPLHPTVNKFGFRDICRFTQEPAVLKRIYVLGKGDKIGSRRLSNQEAFQSIMQHWYGCRFGRDVAQIVGEHRLLQQVSTVVKNCEVMSLTRPVDLKNLDAVAEFIEKDMI